MEKVYLKVEDSDIFYRYLGFKFYFSSNKKRSIFINKVESSYLDLENAKFLNLYKVHINLEIPFLFSLYAKTEKRGFKVEELLDTKVVKRTFYELPEFKVYGIGED